MKLVNEYLRESFRKILPFLLPNRSKEEKTGSAKSQGWDIYCLLSGLYRDLRQRGIEVIVHVILGLPGEAPDGHGRNCPLCLQLRRNRDQAPAAAHPEGNGS